MSTYIHMKLLDVVTHSCLKDNEGLANPLLQLGFERGTTTSSKR